MTDSIPTYYQYWGKADKETVNYHLLPYHCLDVAAVGHVLLSSNAALVNKFTKIIGIKERICIHWLLVYLALHDIGKFSEAFQNLQPDILNKLQGIKSKKEYTTRHDSLGYLFLKTYLENGNPLFNEISDASLDEWYDIIITAIRAYTGHHGKPPQMMGSNGIPLSFYRYFGKNDEDAASQFIKDVQELLDTSSDKNDLPCPYDIDIAIKKASWLISGFIVLCDWIGSNNDWFKFQTMPMNLCEYWETYALPQAQIAVRAAGINAGLPLNTQAPFAQQFPRIACPTPLQSFVADCVVQHTQQIFILEDITGSGKTEAALHLTGRLMSAGCGNGLFIALPTMATSNAMYERLSVVYRVLFKEDTEPSLVLAHSARHLSKDFIKSVHGSDKYGDEETATAQCNAWLADNRKKAQLADVGVGTLDQALLAILPARFQSLRLFGLANHILIIDEVHAYDPYMNKLLQNLLTFHAALGGSAILLSATLPARMRRDYIAAFARGCDDQRCLDQGMQAYPMATLYAKDTGISETPIEPMPQRRCTIKIMLASNESDVIKQIIEATRKGQCICWIRNTVHDAFTGYTALKGKLPDGSLLLFHARYTLGDRLDIEDKVLNTFGKTSTEPLRRGKVLIATQVVEQSLDLDFDLLISDLAPMDLLIQRAGRLHRHIRDEKGNPLSEGSDRREAPCMIIYGPLPGDDADGNWFKSFFPKAAFVYPSHGLLWLTARILGEKRALKMPDDARTLIETAFSESVDVIPAALQQRDQQAEAKWQADKSLAHINMLKLAEGYEATVTQWREDMSTPTRLGEMDVTVRLACWDGIKLTPWSNKGKFSWDMSQVNIRKNLICEETAHDGLLAEAIVELKEKLPDKGKWTILIPLEESDNGSWSGPALNKKGETVLFEYHPLIGASVKKKEV